MTKFCPNCGNNMSDNAKFCMECGAKLSEYTSGGVDMHDSVVQRSQVGAASVGNVNISPVIAGFGTSKPKASTGEKCPKCGSTMHKIKGITTHVISYDRIKTTLTIHHRYSTDAYICSKCRYKCLYSLSDSKYEARGAEYGSGGIWLGDRGRICPECGGDLEFEGTIDKGYFFCETCKWRRASHDDKCSLSYWDKQLPLRNALKLAGYDLLF